jgi:hypothetical protein
VVAQSPEPGAHDKNARLFTITLLLTITIYIKNIKKEKNKNKNKQNKNKNKNTKKNKTAKMKCKYGKASKTIRKRVAAPLPNEDRCGTRTICK